MCMNRDLDLIIKEFPKKQNELHVYAIGDCHVGSAEFDEEALRKKLKIIKDDPVGVLHLTGDLGDFGLKNSKTNVYQAVMQPQEQVNYIYELFKPVAHKITCAISGNHEERLVRESGIDPLLSLCCRWGIEDVYRENIAINKYVFGAYNGVKPNVFIGLTSHGSTRNKHHKFAMGFDNVDFGISAHTHTPEYSPQGRIRIDRIHGTASHVPYKEIVVDAHLKVGGYGTKKEYEIPPPPELQYLELRIVRENDRNRTIRRIINYHSITL